MLFLEKLTVLLMTLRVGGVCLNHSDGRLSSTVFSHTCRDRPQTHQSHINGSDSWSKRVVSVMLFVSWASRGASAGSWLSARARWSFSDGGRVLRHIQGGALWKKNRFNTLILDSGDGPLGRHYIWTRFVFPSKNKLFNIYMKQSVSWWPCNRQ